MFKFFLIAFVLLNLKGFNSSVVKNNLKINEFLNDDKFANVDLLKTNTYQTTDNQNKIEDSKTEPVNELNTKSSSEFAEKNFEELLENGDVAKIEVLSDSPIRSGDDPDSKTTIIVVCVVVGVTVIIVITVLVLRSSYYSNGEKLLCCIVCCEATRCCLECASACSDSNSSSGGGISSGFSGTTFRGDSGNTNSGFAGTSYR